MHPSQAHIGAERQSKFNNPEGGFMNTAATSVNSELGFDFDEFVAELASGKYDHLKKALPAKGASVAKAAKKPLAKKILEQVVDLPVIEIPKIVAYSIQELDMVCQCGCISSFGLVKNVKRQYKNGRISYDRAENYVKETAGLQLPTEKLTSKMEVMQCPNCNSTDEDF